MTKIASDKYVVTTVQTIVRRYYVETDYPEYALDGIVCGELEEFSQQHGSEEPISTQKVEEFPNATPDESVNGAVMVFKQHEKMGYWDTTTNWDLGK